MTIVYPRIEMLINVHASKYYAIFSTLLISWLNNIAIHG